MLNVLSSSKFFAVLCGVLPVMGLAQQNLIVYRGCEEYTVCPTNVFEVEVADALSIGDTGLVEAKLAQYDGSSIQAATLQTLQAIWNDYLTTGIVISPPDSITLFDIACSDPIAYGSGVFVAQNILDWDGGCPSNTAMYQSSLEVLTTTKNSLLLTPNPNNGVFEVNWPQNVIDCWLLGIDGQPIQRIDVNSDSVMVELIPGLYILKLLLSDGAHLVVRFVVN